MQDFGEYLVDIRDRLAEPMTPRVRPVRVFLATLVEGIALHSVLRSFNHHYRSVLDEEYGLCSPERDIHRVVDTFRVLEHVPASIEQVEQARNCLNDEMDRRFQRLSYETRLWGKSVRAALYMALQLHMLASISVMLLLFEGRNTPALGVMLGSFSVWLLCLVACLRGWHRP